MLTWLLLLVFPLKCIAPWAKGSTYLGPGAMSNMAPYDMTNYMLQHYFNASTPVPLFFTQAPKTLKPTARPMPTPPPGWNNNLPPIWNGRVCWSCGSPGTAGADGSDGSPGKVGETGGEGAPGGNGSKGQEGGAGEDGKQGGDGEDYNSGLEGFGSAPFNEFAQKILSGKYMLVPVSDVVLQPSTSIPETLDSDAATLLPKKLRPKFRIVRKRIRVRKPKNETESNTNDRVSIFRPELGRFIPID